MAGLVACQARLGSHCAVLNSLPIVDILRFTMVMLHDFIATHREQLIAKCREKATGRSDSPPVAEKIEQGVPVLLDQLVTVLRAGVEPGPEIAKTALLHGRDLMLAGFSVSEVVHTYGDVCQSITEVAVELDATISAEHFRLLNKCLDDAIAAAVTEFEHKQGQPPAADGKAADEFERFELRHLSKTALLACEAIRSGQVGIGGSTGAVLHRKLTEIVALADRSSSETPLAPSEVRNKR